MRHAFVNDIGDYAKYALLRSVVAHAPIQLGVIWYLTAHTEVNGHGRRRPHLVQEGWDPLDPDLLLQMRAIESRAARARGLDVSLVERSDILPRSTRFFAEPMPLGVNRGPHQRLYNRSAWFARARAAVAGCDIIFLDPDNGIEVKSAPPHSPLAAKYASVKEVTTLLSEAPGVILYQHGNRSPWPQQRRRVIAEINSSRRGVAFRTLRFGAHGVRAYFCMSTRTDVSAWFARALASLEERVRGTKMARYVRVE